MNLSMKQKQNHRHRKQDGGCQGWDVGRRGMGWEFAVIGCKLVYTKWINKIQLYNTGNYIQYPMINYNQKAHEKELYIYI